MSEAVATRTSLQAVIFDLDGTLIDYEGASHTALERPLQQRHQAVLGDGWELPWALHAKIVGMKPASWARVILSELGLIGTGGGDASAAESPASPADAATMQEYIDDYHEVMKEFYAGLRPMPHAVALIKDLADIGVPMAIATSSVRHSFDLKMVYHEEGLLSPMTCVVTGDEVVHGKPAPDIFLLAARRLAATLGRSIDPARCIVFEDSPNGVLAGKSAGMHCVGMPDARLQTDARVRAAGADVVVETLKEFDVDAYDWEVA